MWNGHSLLSVTASSPCICGELRYVPAVFSEEDTFSKHPGSATSHHRWSYTGPSFWFLSEKEVTGVTMPQFTNQAVHFSKLLKMPRNVRAIVRVYHIIQTQEGLRMCKNVLHKLLHTHRQGTSHLPPRALAFELRCSMAQNFFWNQRH